jgi:hypothetical protein
VACPYFFPKERSFTIGWAFPRRLPLGAGFCGSCRAGAEESVPDEATLRDFCNLGHARGCPRMPGERRADSLRFAVARDAEGKIILNYVFDREHAPAGHGQIAFDSLTQKWISTLDDACAQRQAECYLQIYLERKPRH